MRDRCVITANGLGASGAVSTSIRTLFELHIWKSHCNNRSQILDFAAADARASKSLNVIVQNNDFASSLRFRPSFYCVPWDLGRRESGARLLCFKHFGVVDDFAANDGERGSRLGQIWQGNGKNIR